MVGGEEEAVSAVKPLFDVMGKNIVHLGPASSGTPCARHLVAVTIVLLLSDTILSLSSGQHTKMVNQILIATNMVPPARLSPVCLTSRPT
jgi:3-hydroxyisobutyrate dehydrogenase-like beta-hydroxyacid dehydrogenase